MTVYPGQMGNRSIHRVRQRINDLSDRSYSSFCCVLRTDGGLDQRVWSCEWARTYVRTRLLAGVTG